jgi:hypothetical protein
VSGETLRPVLDLVLAGEPYRLAANGRYSLHSPQPPDAFGVIAHRHVFGGDALDSDIPFDYPGSMTDREVDALVQLLGTYIEENGRLKAALAEGAE